MDGFTGFKTATAEELPEAVAVMDPFHVVRLAGEALDQSRRRVQPSIHGHRGRSGDPLYGARRTLHTGADLLTDKQKNRLDTLFAKDTHVQVEANWLSVSPLAGLTTLSRLIASPVVVSGAAFGQPARCCRSMATSAARASLVSAGRPGVCLMTSRTSRTRT